MTFTIFILTFPPLLLPNKMTESNHFDPNNENQVDPFEEQFWVHIVEYAKELGLPVSYVEEEFVIEGELIRHKA